MITLDQEDLETLVRALVSACSQLEEAREIALEQLDAARRERGQLQREFGDYKSEREAWRKAATQELAERPKTCDCNGTDPIGRVFGSGLWAICEGCDWPVRVLDDPLGSEGEPS